MIAVDSLASARSIDALRSIINNRLLTLVPPISGPSEAARYSLLAGGKRVRPMMTIAACLDVGGQIDAALDPACAVEMVHCASLIFDDLPSMDNSALRRGSPTAHMKFGEDVAILAAIGLLNQAFGVLAGAPILSADVRCRATAALSDSVGWQGLVHGQALDLDQTTNAPIDDIHYGKTGTLFVAAAQIGGMCADASAPQIDAMARYGRAIGMAFQSFDDVLDQIATPTIAGKPTNVDGGKRTAVMTGAGPSISGAITRATDYIHAAVEAVTTDDFPHADGLLTHLARHIAEQFHGAFDRATSAA